MTGDAGTWLARRLPAEIKHKRIGDIHEKLVCTRRSKDSSDER
nr:MAG TPA: hypothetical protein [Bacteriophage sp.]